MRECQPNDQPFFEIEYPDFDWKNTPAYKHPGGRNCPCPKHEYIVGGHSAVPAGHEVAWRYISLAICMMVGTASLHSNYIIKIFTS